jgi:hypothetical protein
MSRCEYFVGYYPAIQKASPVPPAIEFAVIHMGVVAAPSVMNIVATNIEAVYRVAPLARSTTVNHMEKNAPSVTSSPVIQCSKFALPVISSTALNIWRRPILHSEVLQMDLEQNSTV